MSRRESGPERGDRRRCGTVVVSLAALFLTWVLALPIGIYSAVRQYSVGDYTATFVGFIGLAVPNFLLALVLLYLGFTLFNANIGGLFTVEVQDAPWSAAKVWDLCKHRRSGLIRGWRERRNRSDHARESADERASPSGDGAVPKASRRSG